MTNEPLKKYLLEKYTDLKDWASLVPTKIWLALIVAVLGIAAALYISGLASSAINSVSYYFETRQLKKENKRDAQTLDEIKKDAGGEKQRVGELKSEGARIEGEVKILGDNYNAAKQTTDQSEEIANRAENRVKRTEQTDYNSVPLTEAERKRCRAFPERKDCR